MNSSQLADIAMFVALVAVPFIALVVVKVRTGMNPVQCSLWLMAYFLCKFLWRARWLDRLQLPPNQGAVIVCNHRSSIDPCFVQTATGRKIHWMVAREYCEHVAFRWFLRTCEVIPVGRGGIDTAATKASIRMVSQGELVGMLPEGRINMTKDLMLPARPGAALVALKARVPIVPCYIKGAPFRHEVWSPIFMTARAEVRFGKPIDLSEFYGREKEPDVVREVMLRVLKSIAELAGQPEFEPQIAGRRWNLTEEEVQAEIEMTEERSNGKPRSTGKPHISAEQHVTGERPASAGR